MKKSFLLFIILLFPHSLHANAEVSDLAANWFEGFSQKIAAKYSTHKEIEYFQTLSERLDMLQMLDRFNAAQRELIDDLIQLSNEYVFEKQRWLAEAETKSILDSKWILKDFKNIVYNPELIFQENWVWYTYRYKTHLFFKQWANISKLDLAHNKISENTSVAFLKDDGNLWFINEYEKIKLISDSHIYGIANKYNFLKEIKDDKKKINKETDALFLHLKTKTRDLTYRKSQKEKIKLIYKFILDNIEYTKQFSLDDAEIFSWIDTYENKNGVCEGYTKIFTYMLSFANVDNSEVMRGFVLDAQDFPQVWHAWVKIDNSYYDPTFDDPIGATKTRTYNEYLYFWLPEDLFYTNRFDFDTIPEDIKSTSDAYREQYIINNTVALLDKYYDYNLLKPLVFRKENSIPYTKELDLDDLIMIVPTYNVENFRFIKNGTIKTITSLKYYTLGSISIEDLVHQLNYDLDDYYLFNWKMEDGSSQYRLAYNVSLR